VDREHSHCYQENPMQETQQRATGSVASPVDDATYDLLQALTSKLEAIEAYQLYAEDEGVRDLFERLGHDEVRHAEDLLEALRARLNNR
jgi:rubrerythrin